MSGLGGKRTLGGRHQVFKTLLAALLRNPKHATFQVMVRYHLMRQQKSEEETELAERIKSVGLQLDEAIRVARERPIPPKSLFNE